MMNKNLVRIIVLLLGGVCSFFLAASNVFATEIIPVPISAEEAFWATQLQVDPLSGESKRVALVDVRTRAEYYWVGAAGAVSRITLKSGKTIAPEHGYVVLTRDGKGLAFYLRHRKHTLRVRWIDKLEISPIAISIPYKLWDEDSATLTDNATFESELAGLSDRYDVLIFFCRSGGRSEDCIGAVDFDPALFSAYYEIDFPEDGAAGTGGFEGGSYSNVFNGYRGFPGRVTATQENESVSWKDCGLPIKTSVNPLAQ